MTNTLRPQRHEIVAGEVRAALGRAGYKQVDLARFFNISKPSAGDLYWGKVPWSIDRLDEIAEWLEIPIEDLVRPSSSTALLGRRITAWRSPTATEFRVRASRRAGGEKYTAGDSDPEPADSSLAAVIAIFRGKKGVRRLAKPLIIPAPVSVPSKIGTTAA